MDELEFYDGAWTGAEIDAGIGLTGTLSDALAIVVDGNQAAVSATIGQYVIVKNSTISGITDGLYTAAKAIPAATTLDATYFTSVGNGGLNDVAARMNQMVQSFEVRPHKQYKLVLSKYECASFIFGAISNSAALQIVFSNGYAKISADSTAFTATFNVDGGFKDFTIVNDSSNYARLGVILPANVSLTWTQLN